MARVCRHRDTDCIKRASIARFGDFGHLDAARVAFTMGRDLTLTPRQSGEPLNYLIYP
ncbi:MAG TPA: hypothetical protein VKV03_09765 [Candidatus Binataceae bacterium]|nr:hypothetical protein [Candidatus Binataceae bacterium]